jgi:hypothetical protein
VTFSFCGLGVIPNGKSTVYDAFKKACSGKNQKFPLPRSETYLCSYLVMQGVDLVTVKQLLGHKTVNMTNRYTHLA